MTPKSKSANRYALCAGASCVLSLLMISSCKKAGSVATQEGPPESAILEACKKDAGSHWGGGNVSDIVRGSPLPPDKGKRAPAGTLMYPIRVVYQQLQEQPFGWDALSHLPRPGELKAMPMRGEFRFVKDEFGEWHSKRIRSEWVLITPGPRINDRSEQTIIQEALKNANINQLKELLEDSKAADQKTGVTNSRETKLREFWLESAQNAINNEIADEEREAEHLFTTPPHDGPVIDGRTIDEFMFLRDWKYPQQARAAMERVKAKEEAELKLHPDYPEVLARYRSDLESAKTERGRRMREEIEYQKQRTLNPQRFPEPHKHYFSPEEIKAWIKAQGKTGP